MPSLAMLVFHQLALHPCPFAMLYYRAVIPPGDDHGYIYITILYMIEIRWGLKGRVSRWPRPRQQDDLET